MDWGQHISDITSKPTKTLGFLCRNLAFAPRSTMEVVYKTFVRPKLGYTAPISSPYCKTQIQQVEKVQRTAACGTCRRWRNTSSFGEMLDELQWPTLEPPPPPPRISPPRSSSTIFIVGLCLFIKTSIWPRLRVHYLPGHHHTTQYCRPQTYSDALKYSFPKDYSPLE